MNKCIFIESCRRYTYFLSRCLSTTPSVLLRQSKNMVRSSHFAKYSTPSGKLTLSCTEGSKNFQVLDHTFGHLLGEASEKFSDKILVQAVEQNVQLTYAEALRKADRLAAGLLSLGLRKGDRVALWAPNIWEWLVVEFALARSGLIAVPINPMLVGVEALHCLSLTKIAAVIAPEENKNIRHLQLLEQLAPELRDAPPGKAKCSRLPHLKAAICISGRTPSFAVGIEELAAFPSESDVKNIASMQSEISPDDAVHFPFSSGTTGKPKAVVISHKSFVNNSKAIAQAYQHKGDEQAVFCVQVPFFHAFALVAVISANLHIGGKMVLPSKNYSPIANLQALSQQQCTILTGTPTMYLDLIRQSEVDGKPSHAPNVAICGGAPLVPQLGKDILDILKVKRLLAIYGLTETSAAAFLGSPEDTFEHMCNTVGSPSPLVEVKVVDSKGEIVPVNTSGELFIRGYLIMKEYFDHPHATTESITPDGWFKTGDQFLIDEDGRGKVIGRFKDIIIRGGENISPKEIEDVLTTHAAIIDAQVVGVNDDRLGEEVCACLIVKEPVTGALIKDICKDKIASFKTPKYYIIMKEYPRTTSGKIQKNKMRDICNKHLKDEELLLVNI